ncbi:MAG: acyl carrier protein, partial [Pikeienuella sp.]
HLRQALAHAADGGDAIADDGRFFDMGLDSMGGVALVGELERALALPLDPTVIYEHPTPAALADHLLAALFAAPAKPGPRPAAQSPDGDMRALEALLDADP